MSRSIQVDHVANGADKGLPASHPPADAEAAASTACELDLFGAATIKPPAAGRGRPRGALNRSTLQMQRWLLERGYRDPAEFLAAVTSTNTADLARDLSCPKAEALAHQVRAASELMAYFYSRMPLAVDVTRSDAPRKLIVMGDVFHAAVQPADAAANDASSSAFPAPRADAP